MSLSYIQYDIVEQTAVITIDRESVYNALNKDAKAEIVQAITRSNEDENIRSIVFYGAGKAFCTGQDLNDRNISTEAGPVDLGQTLEQEWIPLMKAIRYSEKPIIAAVNGVCAGAGLSLALSCDMIIAQEKVRFISGFSKLGLAPDAGSSYILSRALGHQKSLEFFLFNNPLYSEDLFECGLVNKVTKEPLRDAVDWAKQINALAPQAVKHIKKNVQNAFEQDYEQTLRLETQAQRFLGNSEDYQEGLKAFFEKRQPVFKGK